MNTIEDKHSRQAVATGFILCFQLNDLSKLQTNPELFLLINEGLFKKKTLIS
jgi:hypothetical protein